MLYRETQYAVRTYTKTSLNIHLQLVYYVPYNRILAWNYVLYVTIMNNEYFLENLVRNKGCSIAYYFAAFKFCGSDNSVINAVVLLVKDEFSSAKFRIYLQK